LKHADPDQDAGLENTPPLDSCIRALGGYYQNPSSESINISTIPTQLTYPYQTTQSIPAMGQVLEMYPGRDGGIAQGLATSEKGHEQRGRTIPMNSFSDLNILLLILDLLKQLAQSPNLLLQWISIPLRDRHIDYPMDIKRHLLRPRMIEFLASAHTTKTRHNTKAKPQHKRDKGGGDGWVYGRGRDEVRLRNSIDRFRLPRHQKKNPHSVTVPLARFYSPMGPRSIINKSSNRRIRRRGGGSTQKSMSWFPSVPGPERKVTVILSSL